MDPQATWERLLDAYADDDRDGAVEHATALLAWLEKGGFPPRTVSHRRLRPAADRLIALATCRLALERQPPGRTT